MTLSLAALLATALGAVGAAPPSIAPDFDYAEARPAVVVATSRPGRSLPAPAECDEPDTICLRYPLWFRIDVLRTVYGTSPAKPAFVSTYTHYGQPEADDADGPRLLLLLGHEGHAFMPTYASARVWRRSDGEYFLPVVSPEPIHWLPCDAMRLREEIDDAGFPPGIRFEADAYSVRQHPELFREREQAFVPRYAIPVRRLGEWLANRRPRPEEFDCTPDEEDSAAGE